MRIPSGKTDQRIYFVAYDATDLVRRLTGLTTFTVYRSRNTDTATAYTTPTVDETDATNMPGVYSLLVDEDTTIAATSDSEEYCVHITQASMAPVTRTIELYRSPPTAAVVAAAVWAEVIDGTRTAAQVVRGFIAALLGKASGLPTAPKYRDIADTKNVIDATTDADGNRTAVTLDLT